MSLQLASGRYSELLDVAICRLLLELDHCLEEKVKLQEKGDMLGLYPRPRGLHFNPSKTTKFESDIQQ